MKCRERGRFLWIPRSFELVMCKFQDKNLVGRLNRANL